MHTAHFYCTATELKKKKKKKSKNNKGQNIINIDIGDFTKEVDNKGNAIPHEVVMNIPKVNIEFDEKNVIIDDNDEEGNDEFP